MFLCIFLQRKGGGEYLPLSNRKNDILEFGAIKVPWKFNLVREPSFVRRRLYSQLTTLVVENHSKIGRAEFFGPFHDFLETHEADLGHLIIWLHNDFPGEPSGFVEKYYSSRFLDKESDESEIGFVSDDTCFFFSFRLRRMPWI